MTSRSSPTLSRHLRGSSSAAPRFWAQRIALALTVAALVAYAATVKRMSDSYQTELREEQEQMKAIRERAHTFAQKLAACVGQQVHDVPITSEELVNRRRNAVSRVLAMFGAAGDTQRRRRVLDLSKLGLASLPDDLSMLQEAYGGLGVTDLLLSDNELRALPSALGELSTLEQLYLRGNHLVFLPDSLGKLKLLMKLDAKNNELTHLPDTISGMTSLRTLDLSQNNLAMLPSTLGSLANLEELNLRSNQLDGSHTHELTTLPNLRKLTLADNELAYLSEDFRHLARLEYLNLQNTGLVELPKLVGDWAKMESMNLSYNRLSALPVTFAHLHGLKVLNVRNNQFEILPAQLDEMPSIEVIQVRDNPMCVRRTCPMPKHLSTGGGAVAAALPAPVDAALPAARMLRAAATMQR